MYDENIIPLDNFSLLQLLKLTILSLAIMCWSNLLTKDITNEVV